MKLEKLCKSCNSPFFTTRGEVNRGNGKYCSLSCSSTARLKARTIPSPNVKCSTCGIPFYKSPSKITKSKSSLYFCCREHKDQAQKIGGIKEIQPHHYGTGHSRYREKAFKFLPNKCNRCGYNRYISILDVHHIDKNRKNSNLDNLEILCRNCHGEEHYLRG